jgi:hydrogenase maturation factor
MVKADTLPKGKLRGEELRRIVLKHLPMLNETASLSLDFSRIPATPRDIVISCDPIIGIPPQYYGFSAIHVSGADIAVAGVKPRYLELGVYYPPDYPADWLDKNMHELGEEARRLGIKIIGGHTGGYDGLTLPLISTTCIGIVEDKLLSSSEIKPDDKLIISGPVTHEMAVFLSFVESDKMRRLLGSKRTDELRNGIRSLTVIEPALAAAHAGARAMHDVAEGGTSLALKEMSEASKLGIKLDYDEVPWSKEGLLALETYGADPLSSSSFGSILIAAPEEHVGEIVEALQGFGRPAKEVGYFFEGKGVIVRKGEKESELEIRDDIYGQFTKKL